VPDEAHVASRAADAPSWSEGWAGQRSLRKQREVNDARRADGSLAGVLQSALECREKRGCGESPIKYSGRWLTEG
jgi:hypothetical protein